TWNSWCLIPTTMELVGCSAEPAPGATISSTATVCAGSTVALSLENSPIEQGLTYQWYASTDGGATWTPGPTTTTWNAVVNEETIFYCEVTCENAGTANSTPVSVTMNAPYECNCTTYAVNFDVEPITLVQFAGINNTTCADINCDGALMDYTGGTPGVVAAGESYTITVKGNTGGDWTNFFTVFFDWDRDGLFETSQVIGSITNSNGTDSQQASTTVEVPLLIPDGPPRERVVKNFNT